MSTSMLRARDARSSGTPPEPQARTPGSRSGSRWHWGRVQRRADGRTRVRSSSSSTTALDALATEASACIAVEGEPGIGKTHLLAELREPRRGARLPRARRRGDGVRARAAVRRLGRCAGRVRRLAGARPHGRWNAELGRRAGGDRPVARGAAATAPTGPLPTSATARTAPCGSCSSCSRRTGRWCVVLDDLHWSDQASIELLAALLRRGADAPVLLALAFRPRQAPARLSAALATPSARRIALEPLTRGPGDRAARRARPAARRDDVPPRRREPVLPRAAQRAAGEGRASRADASATDAVQVAGVAVPAAVAASLAEELASLPATSACCFGRRRSRGAVRARPRRGDRRARVPDGLGALDGLLALDLVRTTQVPRRFVFRHPLVRRAVYERRPGGWRLAAHARAAAALAARGAPAGERAHHVEQYGRPRRRGGDRAAARRRSRRRARAPGGSGALVRGGPALLPAADVTRQVDVRIALASSLRSLGELEPAGRRCWRRSSCSRRTRPRRGSS